MYPVIHVCNVWNDEETNVQAFKQSEQTNVQGKNQKASRQINKLAKEQGSNKTNREEEKTHRGYFFV